MSKEENPNMERPDIPKPKEIALERSSKMPRLRHGIAALGFVLGIAEGGKVAAQQPNAHELSLGTSRIDGRIPEHPMKSRAREILKTHADRFSKEDYRKIEGYLEREDYEPMIYWKDEDKREGLVAFAFREGESARLEVFYTTKTEPAPEKSEKAQLKEKFLASLRNTDHILHRYVYTLDELASDSPDGLIPVGGVQTTAFRNTSIANDILEANDNGTIELTPQEREILELLQDFDSVCLDAPPFRFFSIGKRKIDALRYNKRNNAEYRPTVDELDLSILNFARLRDVLLPGRPPIQNPERFAPLLESGYLSASDRDFLQDEISRARTRNAGGTLDPKDSWLYREAERLESETRALFGSVR